MDFRSQFVAAAAALLLVAGSRASAQSAGSTQAALANLQAMARQGGGAAPSAAAASSSSPSSPASAPAKTSLFEIAGAPVELRLDVGVWLPRLRGNVTFSGGPAPINLDLSNALSLNSMEACFQGDLSATWKNWTLRAMGTSFSTSGSQAAPAAGSFGATPFLAGQVLSNNFSYWTWGIETESWLWRPFSKQAFPWLNPAADESLPVDLRLVALIGGRGFCINQGMTNTATASSSSFSGTFGTVYAGGGAEIRFDTHEAVGFLQRVDVYAVIAAGPAWPGSLGLFMEINAGAVAWITNNVGVYAEYQNLRQNVNTGGYNLDSYVGGLNFGLSVKF